MANEIFALAQKKAQAAVKRAVVPAAFGVVALAFIALAVLALFAALFFWLTPKYGPTVGALIVAAVAFVIGLIATLPLVIRPRQPPPPPPGTALPQFVSLMAQSAPALGAKRAALAAGLLAVAFGLMSRGGAGKK